MGDGKGDINWDDFIYASLGSANTPVFETEQLSRVELAEWNSKAYKEFYLRFPYMWKRLTGMRSYNDLKMNLKGFSMFKNLI